MSGKTDDDYISFIHSFNNFLMDACVYVRVCENVRKILKLKNVFHLAHDGWHWQSVLEGLFIRNFNRVI